MNNSCLVYRFRKRDPRRWQSQMTKLENMRSPRVAVVNAPQTLNAENGYINQALNGSHCSQMLEESYPPSNGHTMTSSPQNNGLTMTSSPPTNGLTMTNDPPSPTTLNTSLDLPCEVEISGEQPHRVTEAGKNEGYDNEALEKDS